MTDYWTNEANVWLVDYLHTHKLVRGLGDDSATCSLGAINLALYGEVTVSQPHPMSRVIARWMLPVNDAMPDKLRNSAVWKGLLPVAAGSGWVKYRETERLEILMDWLWGKVLPTFLPTADSSGFGHHWRRMCDVRTRAAAATAANAADMVGSFSAACAAAEAEAAAYTYDSGSQRARSVGRVLLHVGHYDEVETWADLDPIGLLARLVQS